MTGSRSRWWRSAAWVLGLCLVYATLRLTMNEEYVSANWRAVVELRAPLPFGHRVLMPLLAQPLLAVGFGLVASLWILEVVAAVALVVALRFAVAELPPRLAWTHAVAFVYVLAFAYLLPHRWPIFYPWDTPAMAAVAAGVAFAVRGRFGLGVLLTAVAALNRESAIVVPAVMLVLHLHAPAERRRRVFAWAGLMVVAYASVRAFVAATWPDAVGPSLHFTVGGRYRLFTNLEWLAHPRHAALFVGGLGLLPLGFLGAAAIIPSTYRRLHLVATGLACGLMVVANAYEPRAWGEVLVLLWVPIAAAAPRWLELGPVRSDEPPPRWLGRIDRLGALGLALGLAAFALALRQWSFLPIAQWPMPGS